MSLTESQAKEALANCSKQDKAILKALAESEHPEQAVRLLELKYEFPTAQLVDNRPDVDKTVELIRIGHAPVRSEELSQAWQDEGMARVDENADDDWKMRALKAIEKVCRQKAIFTPDDVWEYVEKPPPGTAPQALGPLMVKARGLGWCIPTGQFVPSNIPSQHKNPIREWKSLLVPEEGTLL